MNQDARHAGHRRANRPFDLAAQDVRVLKRHGLIRLNVQVDEVFGPDLADPQFLDGANICDALGYRCDLRENRPIGHPVHQVINRGAEQKEPVNGDDTGGQQGRPGVGRFPTRSAPERDSNPDQGGGSK